MLFNSFYFFNILPYDSNNLFHSSTKISSLILAPRKLLLLHGSETGIFGGYLGVNFHHLAQRISHRESRVEEESVVDTKSGHELWNIVLL